MIWTKARNAVTFVLNNSLLLLVGAIAALLWANADHAGYMAFRNLPLVPPESFRLAGHPFDLYYLVNDVLMAFFFALAGKQVWTAMLPGGPLHDVRTAATPIICTLGGMAGPALLFVLGATAMGRFSELGHGWAIPCATDIAFSYMIARLAFGPRHQAIAFLLLLAIADDALGLVVLFLFYPVGPVCLYWLALPAVAVALGLLMRRKGVRSFWPYLLLPGVMSWIGFALTGLHPALGLLPVIPTMPHAPRGESEAHWGTVPLPDALDRFEAFWKTPVELILGLFALMNAGVTFRAAGPATLLVAVALLVGKPMGIYLSGILSVRFLPVALPEGIGRRELFLIGCTAGIGFTVALFVTSVAFDPGPIQDAARMGALLSGLAAVTTLVAAKVLGHRGP